MSPEEQQEEGRRGELFNDGERAEKRKWRVRRREETEKETKEEAMLDYVNLSLHLFLLFIWR